MLTSLLMVTMLTKHESTMSTTKNESEDVVTRNNEPIAFTHIKT